MEDSFDDVVNDLESHLTARCGVDELNWYIDTYSAENVEQILRDQLTECCRQRRPEWKPGDEVPQSVRLVSMYMDSVLAKLQTHKQDFLVERTAPGRMNRATTDFCLQLRGHLKHSLHPPAIVKKIQTVAEDAEKVQQQKEAYQRSMDDYTTKTDSLLTELAMLPPSQPSSFESQ